MNLLLLALTKKWFLVSHLFACLSIILNSLLSKGNILYVTYMYVRSMTVTVSTASILMNLFSIVGYVAESDFRVWFLMNQYFLMLKIFDIFLLQSFSVNKYLRWISSLRFFENFEIEQSILSPFACNRCSTSLSVNIACQGQLR